MTDATSISCEKIMDTQNGWQLLQIKGTLTNGETLTIPTSGDGSWVSTGTEVCIVSCNNLSDGTSAGTVSATYTAASRLFTVTDAGASDNDVRVLFLAKDE